MQRFPKLHTQIIEVVSELLRERLGPTSNYTQSLIDIQAAYINTNHPAFVQGSLTASRQTNSPVHQRKILPQRVRAFLLSRNCILILSRSLHLLSPRMASYRQMKRAMTLPKMASLIVSDRFLQPSRNGRSFPHLRLHPQSRRLGDLTVNIVIRIHRDGLRRLPRMAMDLSIVLLRRPSWVTSLEDNLTGLLIHL